MNRGEQDTHEDLAAVSAQADELCKGPHWPRNDSPCGRPADEGPCPYPHETSEATP